MDDYIKQKALQNLVSSYKDDLPISIALLAELDNKINEIPLNLSLAAKKINSSLQSVAFDTLEEQSLAALNSVLDDNNYDNDEERTELLTEAACKKVLLELAYMTGVKDCLANTDLMRGLLIAVNDDLPIYFNFKKEVTKNKTK